MAEKSKQPTQPAPKKVQIVERKGNVLPTFQNPPPPPPKKEK